MSESVERVITVQNTFGSRYWLAGRLIPSRPEVATIVNTMLAFLLWGVAGTPTAVFVLVAVVNDILRGSNMRKDIDAPVPVLTLKEGSWRLGGQVDSSKLLGGDRAAKPVSTESSEDSEDWEEYTSSKEPEAISVPFRDVEEKSTQKDVQTESLPDPALDAGETLQDRPEPVKMAPSPWSGTAMTLQPKKENEVAEPESSNDYPSLDEIADILKSKPSNRDRYTHPDVSGGEGQSLIDQGVASELLRRENGYLRSWFCMGVPGSGKGAMLYYATVLAKAEFGDDVSIWAIDPKADPDELNRWVHIPEHQRYHYDALQPAFSDEDVTRIQTGVMRIFNGYAADPSQRKILIVDEIPAVLRSLGPKKGKRAFAYCHSIARVGRSRFNVVWLFSNAVGLGANGITGADKSAYHTLYLATPTNLHEITGYQYFEGQKIKRTNDVFDKTGRAAWISTTGEWESVPTTYGEIVDALPLVSPPTGFGSGEYKDSSGAIVLAQMADALADALIDMGITSLALEALMKETEFASVLEGKSGEELGATVRSIAEGLKQHSDVVGVRKIKGAYRVRLPQQNKREASPAESNQDSHRSTEDLWIWSE